MKLSFLKVSSLQELSQKKKTSQNMIPEEVEETVKNILADISDRGQEAILDYVEAFDGYKPRNWPDVKVGTPELEEGYKYTKDHHPELVQAMKVAMENITYYHQQQMEHESKTWFNAPRKGKKLGQLVNPLKRVGIYVPGGRYPYPSSVLMGAIPAMIAGVKEIAVCSPPLPGGKANPALLYLCRKLGIEEIYKIGGAQAIGLFAYGTDDTGKVDKVVGPGNIYVTSAKREVYGQVGIDSLAGPSEIVVIADASAEPSFVAADLLSQAEHDPQAVSILLTTDQYLGLQVIEQLGHLLDSLGQYGQNREIAERSLRANCSIVYDSDMQKLVKACNQISPEHLEIACSNSEQILKQINNAGAIFMGNYTPVAVGDYIGGTNHIIPTSGNARFSSPLGVYDFLKKSSVMCYSRDMLAEEKKYIQDFSAFERLYAHNHSIGIRFEQD